ncbi:MAG: ribonuclease H-like domain-containing protein [Armatimonadota bacterium]
MKLDRSLHQRLSDLERGKVSPPRPAPAAESATAPAPAGQRHTVGEAEERHGALEDLLPGQVRASAEGEYWQIITPLAHFGEWSSRCSAGFGCAAEHTALASALPHGNVDRANVVFFDTETAGLNNEPLFLVGMLCGDGVEPYIRQLLARDYSEEPAVLAESRRLLAQADLIVSYNGITFDVPYLRNRLRYHKLGKLELPSHLDLLPVARARLGRSLGNCKLQTLEQHLCRRERCNDIPGAQIPQAYHDFVADGDAGRLCRIIEHNSFDVITLAELTAHLQR